MSQNPILSLALVAIFIISDEDKIQKSITEKISVQDKNLKAVEKINTYIIAVTTANEQTKGEIEKLYTESPVKDSGEYVKELKTALGDFNKDKLTEFKTKVTEEVKKQKTLKMVWEKIEALHKANTKDQNGEALLTALGLSEDDKKDFKEKTTIEIEKNKGYTKADVEKLIVEGLKKLGVTVETNSGTGTPAKGNEGDGNKTDPPATDQGSIFSSYWFWGFVVLAVLVIGALVYYFC